MTSQNQVEAFNRRELAQVQRAFKAMDAKATEEAQAIGYELAKFAVSKIQAAANGAGAPAQKIAQGAKAYKSSKVGEMGFGYASQKFSGGGTTQINKSQDGGPGILAGWEFGSKTYKQFPAWSGPGPNGTGSKGRFIYPTLRAIQPSIVEKWQQSFNEILRKWAN